MKLSRVRKGKSGFPEISNRAVSGCLTRLHPALQVIQLSKPDQDKRTCNMGSHRDVFPDVPALKSRLKEKRDFRIRSRDRGAFATIVSPHGGYIEEGTSALARACAGPDFNFFDFQGLRTENPSDLHVTSTHF